MKDYETLRGGDWAAQARLVSTAVGSGEFPVLERDLFGEALFQPVTLLTGGTLLTRLKPRSEGASMQAVYAKLHADIEANVGIPGEMLIETEQARPWVNTFSPWYARDVKQHRERMASWIEDMQREVMQAMVSACAADLRAPERRDADGLTYDDLRRVWVASEDVKPRLRRVRLSDKLVQFYRRPRSKKGRVVKKWRKRPENWRPHPLLFQERLILGCNAALHGYGVASSPVAGRPGVSDKEVFLLAHPVTWARACERCPELRDVEVVR